ncbi:Hypothetical predicted protein [Pelobates cultripes]|uniref:Uncharacterized protein n=1 Tax=Pelobates cultripes TaxID=61616 RepID=A0AAD1T0R2_PELCU|nr:Hypothetical predicted protein [Pelobates cultripes]
MPEMAPLSDGLSSSDKISADGENYDVRVPTRPMPPRPMPAAKPPITEDILRTLLDELNRNIATDIRRFREEMNGVSAHLHHTEFNFADHENQIQPLEKQLSTLQWSQMLAQENMAATEDKRHWKKIKIRGLPDTLEPTEFPHLFCRLLNALFSSRQAKAMPLDGWYRIPKPTTSSQGTSRDTIVRFQQSQDRMAFMAAIRNRSPFQFEEHSLTFFSGLSRATLEWRRSLRPLTKELIAHKIPYCWGTPRSLIIPKENCDLKITNTAEIPDTL